MSRLRLSERWGLGHFCAVFLIATIITTPVVRLIETAPETTFVTFEAAEAGPPLTGVLIESQYAQLATTGIDAKNNVTLAQYELDVTTTWTTPEFTVNFTDKVLTVHNVYDYPVMVKIDDTTVFFTPGSGAHSARLKDQPTVLNNVWKATWFALAATVLVYAVSRKARRPRDHTERLGHMNQVMGS